MSERVEGSTREKGIGVENFGWKRGEEKDLYRKGREAVPSFLCSELLICIQCHRYFNPFPTHCFIIVNSVDRVALRTFHDTDFYSSRTELMITTRHQTKVKRETTRTKIVLPK